MKSLTHENVSYYTLNAGTIVQEDDQWKYTSISWLEESNVSLLCKLILQAIWQSQFKLVPKNCFLGRSQQIEKGGSLLAESGPLLGIACVMPVPCP